MPLDTMNKPKPQTTKEINIIVEDIDRSAIVPCMVYVSYSKQFKKNFTQTKIHIPLRLASKKRELYFLTPMSNLIIEDQPQFKQLFKMHDHAEKKKERKSTAKNKSQEDGTIITSEGEIIKPKSWKIKENDY